MKNPVKLFVSVGLLGLLAVAATGQIMPQGCVNPVDFGAKTVEEEPGFDSRPAFEAAISAIRPSGGELCIPPGRFRVTRAPAGSYNRFAAISLHRSNVAVRGAGEHSTFIEMSGDQGNGATYVLALDPGARDVRVSDLTFDTSGMTNTDEQTHVVGVGTGVCSNANGTCSMPTADVTVERVRFIHPRPTEPGKRKGDCIRILGGSPATPALRTRLIGVTFSECARSSLALQRNADGLTLLGNHFVAPGVDQQIDGEATGGEWDHDLVMVGNTFVDSASAQGDFAVAISSQARAVIQGNVLNGRGIGIYRATDVVLSGNVIEATMKSGGGVVAIGNQVERIAMSGNVVRRLGADGPVIRVLPQSGGMASEGVISGNVIDNRTDGPSVYLQAPSRYTVSDNSIAGNGGPNSVGIEVFSSPRAASAIVSGNRVTGTTYAGVRLKGSTYGFGPVTLLGNQVTGSARGLLCEGQAPASPIVSSANSWETVSCSFPTTSGQ